MNISLAGLSPADTLIVKNYFRQYAQDLNVEWVGINASQADVLIFRAKFFHMPAVEQWILSAPAHAVLAAVFRDPKSFVASQQAGVYGLNIASHDREQIRAWIEQISSSKSNIANIQQRLKNTLAESASAASSQPTASIPVAQAAPRVSPVEPKAPGEKALSFPNADVLEAVLHQQKDFIAYNAGNVAWLLPRENRVRTNHKTDAVPGFDTCLWKPAGVELAPELPLSIDLKQWLWESLWNSTIDFEPLVDVQLPYQLKRWPQPRATQNRSLPLRIAALIQKGPASIAALAQLTETPPQRVMKIMYSMRLVGFVEPVQAVLPSMPQAVREKAAREKAVKESPMMGIFRKIREKFQFSLE